MTLLPTQHYSDAQPVNAQASSCFLNRYQMDSIDLSASRKVLAASRREVGAIATH